MCWIKSHWSTDKCITPEDAIRGFKVFWKVTGNLIFVIAQFRGIDH